MEKQTPKKKVLKSYRLRPEIVDAIQAGMQKHGYSEETAYLEAILELALRLTPKRAVRPKVSRRATALAA